MSGLDTIPAGAGADAAAAQFDGALQAALKSAAVPGVLVDHRLIQAGDEDALQESERRSIKSGVLAVRRASGAARIVARRLLADLGCPASALPKGPTGAPLWPAGSIGSLAHDDSVAVAAVARAGAFRSIGIDIEPAVPLPAEMIELVTTPRERLTLDGDPLRGRLYFTVKEAVYKAVQPIDPVFLEFHDIEVDLAAGQALVRSERAVNIRFCAASHVVALAYF